MNYPLQEEETWNSAAMRMVLQIFVLFRGAAISWKMSDIRDTYDVLLTRDKLAAWTTDFINLGGVALTAATDAGLNFSPGEIYEVLCNKQQDYGHENIAKFGRDGILVRIHDKIARLEHLTRPDAPAPKNETIRDNYLDVIGYCVIGAMWEAEEFLLPLTVAESELQRGYL